MAGQVDFWALQSLDSITGRVPLVVANSNRFLSMWTTAPTADAGTGGTEASGSSYARTQFAGALTLNASFTTSSTTLTLASTAPAWLLALGTGAGANGANVYDMTNGQQIGTVQGVSGTTVTLTSTAAHASSGAADSIQFCAFPASAASSGTEPSAVPVTATSGCQINFAQFSGALGTLNSWGIHDAVTSGNFYFFDWLNLSGAGKWSPFSATSASPGVFTVTDQTFTNANNCVVSSKIAGSLPSLSAGSFSGVLTFSGVSGNTFNLQTSGAVALNTSSIGDGLIRPITPIVIGATPTTLQFPSGGFIVALP